MKKNMERAVLFFDIDGTILSEMTHQVPESTVQALRAAQEEGHLLFINTGRTVCCLPEELDVVAFDGFLCGCGTYLIYRNEVLFSRSIGEERGRELLRKAEECGIGCVAEGTEDIYFPRRRSRFQGIEQSREYFRSQGMSGARFLEDGDFIYDKLFIFCDGESDLEGFLKFASGDMEAISRGRGAYEVVQKGYSKATACDFIMKRLGIPEERAYVFGDSGNDLSMFTYAKHTIAMGKHDPVLEPYTEFVTSTVEDGGIARALEHYGLIRPERRG